MVLVRPARAADYEAFSRLFPELAVDDPTPDRARFEGGMMATTLVAEAEESAGILGYAFFQVLRTTTYVRNLVTAPDARRRGIARLLMARVAEAARAAGCTHWALNVKPENVAAVELYRACGLVRTLRAFPISIPWPAATTSTAPAPLVEVPPADDAALERLAEQEEGLFAAQRKRGRRILGVRDASGAWAGVAVFEPTFPGAFPFWVARVEDALGFVAALAPLAPGTERVMIAVEGREDVADALLAAGGTLRMNIDQMKGPLPA